MKASNFTGALFTSLLVFSILGYVIDSHFHTMPLFICVGVAYSIFGCFYLLMKKTRSKDE